MMYDFVKGETKAPLITPQDQKMKLVQKQNLELEKQRVTEMLEMERGREADKAIITDLEDQQEYLQSMVNDLIFKERTSNDELEEARKVALKVGDLLKLYTLCEMLTKLIPSHYNLHRDQQGRNNIIHLLSSPCFISSPCC